MIIRALIVMIVICTALLIGGVIAIVLDWIGRVYEDLEERNGKTE